MTQFNPFSCPTCGGSVRLLSVAGRTREFRRGVPPLPLPKDLKLPTCGDCSELFVLPEFEESVQSAMRVAYVEWQTKHLHHLVATLTQRHRTKKRQLAGVCGITPSHLSHLLSGTDVASATLLRFVEAMVACPLEFERHLRGDSFYTDGVFPFRVHATPNAYNSSSSAKKVRRWKRPDWHQETGSANDNSVGSVEASA